MDWRAADARGEQFPICDVNVADRERRARHLAQSGNASSSARTGPGKHRARSGCAAFSSELAFARPSGLRSHADSIRHRGIRFDCSTCGNRSNPPNMARLGTVTRATRTFRLSHDAGNNRAPETTRRSVAKERRSLVRVLKGTDWKPPLLESFDSKEVQLSFKSLNAASASALCPFTEARHPSIGCSNSA